MEKKNYKKALILAAVLLAGICAGVFAGVLYFQNEEETAVLAPDYAPEETEENAEKTGDEGAEKNPQPEGGGSVSLTYSRQAEINLDEKTISFVFENPSRSNQSMVLQILAQDVVIAQSDTLPPGYELRSLSLEEGVEFEQGTYEGKFLISFYDEGNGEKAAVNTEIPITIQIQ